MASTGAVAVMWPARVVHMVGMPLLGKLGFNVITRQIVAVDRAHFVPVFPFTATYCLRGSVP